jgi:hypothetical protein
LFIAIDEILVLLLALPAAEQLVKDTHVQLLPSQSNRRRHGIAAMVRPKSASLPDASHAATDPTPQH